MITSQTATCAWSWQVAGSGPALVPCLYLSLGTIPQRPLGHDPVVNLSVDRVSGEHGGKAKGNSTTSNSHCKHKSLNPCMTLIKKGISW